MAAVAAAERAPPVVEEGARSGARYVEVNKAYPGLRQVNDSPPIYVVDNFLTPAECAALMEAGAPGLKRSIVVDGAAGKSAAPSRTSESCYLVKAEQPWLHAKVEALTGKPTATHEPAQVARYEGGQFYLAHFDAFDMATGPGRECALTGGQRVATVLIYLVSVADGGGTYFPKLDKRFLPVAGTAVVFFPATVDGRLDPLALHAAERTGPETVKWVSQIWIRQADFEKPIPRDMATAIGAM